MFALALRRESLREMWRDAQPTGRDKQDRGQMALTRLRGFGYTPTPAVWIADEPRQDVREPGRKLPLAKEGP